MPQSEALAESNPVFDEGRGLVVVADGGATPDSPSSAPINEGSSISPVSDAVAQGRAQPVPATSAVDEPVSLTPDEILPADVPLVLNTNRGRDSNKGLILLVAAGIFVYLVARRKD